MIDAGESAVHHDIEALLAAIIGMGAPIDIGEQAGGMTQPFVLRAFFKPQRIHETVGPLPQILGHGAVSANRRR